MKTSCGRSKGAWHPQQNRSLSTDDSYATTNQGRCPLEEDRAQRSIDGQTGRFGSGCAPERNFPANRFPFRASSHFLHFVGMSLENAFLVLSDTEETLFCPEQLEDDIVWHGVRPSLKDLSEQVGMPVKPLRTLSEHLPKTYHFLAKDGGCSCKMNARSNKPSMALPRVISEAQKSS